MDLTSTFLDFLSLGYLTGSRNGPGEWILCHRLFFREQRDMGLLGDPLKSNGGSHFHGRSHWSEKVKHGPSPVSPRLCDFGQVTDSPYQ